jgi:hypothetical protein
MFYTIEEMRMATKKATTKKPKSIQDALKLKMTVRDEYKELAKSDIKVPPGAVKNFVHNF